MSTPSLNETKQRLERAGQMHLLAFWDRLDEKQRAHLLAEIARLLLEHLASMLAQAASLKRPAAGDIRPVRPYLRTMADAEKYRGIGAELVRRGKVAAFIVAGGQGTRLGWRGPWGTTYASNLRLVTQSLNEEGWLRHLHTRAMRPPMPSYVFRDMTEQEIRDIYKFIRSLGPAGGPVPAYVPPDQEPKPPYVQWPSPPPAP